MKIIKPIIIVGTGRCGSTMLHRLIARHEQHGWLSTFNEVMPTQPWLSTFSNLYRQPIFSQKTKHLAFFPKPYEAYRFWEHYLPGFSRRDKPQTAADVPTEAIQPVHECLGQVLKFQKRPRALVKVTGWSRIAYFDRLFPDAYFVFLNREHRSIVSSWVQAGWLDVTSAPDSQSWQWGKVPPEYYKLWQELGGSPILSAAVKIQLDLDDIRKNVAQFQSSCYKLEYEDLIREPQTSLRQLADFCELDWTQQFEDEINSMTFYNPANKWRQYLSEQEGNLIVEFFERADAYNLALG